jgi:hypothetical protein
MWYAAIQAMLGKLYVLSLYFTLYAPVFFGTPVVGASHCLRLTLFGDRNNRMDLATNEPPVTYATTMDVSLDSMGSPTRGYVFSVHFPDREQVC